MNTIDYFSILIPISMCMFALEYLSDAQLENKELKIGILDYLHHLIATICTFGLPISVFYNRGISIVFINVVVFTISQMGFVINKDSCWLTTKINKLINKKRINRIWRSDLSTLIKHYIRGDDYAYKDIYNDSKLSLTLFINILIILNIKKINERL